MTTRERWPTADEVEQAMRLEGRPERYPHWADSEHVLEAEVRRLRAVLSLLLGSLEVSAASWAEQYEKPLKQEDDFDRAARKVSSLIREGVILKVRAYKRAITDPQDSWPPGDDDGV